MLLDTSLYSTGAVIADAVIASGSTTAQVVRVPNYSSALLAGNGREHRRLVVCVTRRRSDDEQYPRRFVPRLDLWRGV